PLLPFPAEIAELAGRGIADPFPDREVQPAGRAGGLDVAAKARDPHHVADPAELRVLGLEEMVVRELGYRFPPHAGRRPVELHAQPLGEHAVVEVLAMPRLA